MKLTYKILRAVLVTLIALAVVLPVSLYIGLATPWGQDLVRTTAERELTKLLGTDVRIGSVSITPFNRIDADSITVADDNGKTALIVGCLDARFEMWHFLTTGRIMVDYVSINGIDGKVYRETATSPLNIAGIIEKLKGKDEKKEKRPFDFAIETVKIRNGSFSYDVLDRPHRVGRFDASHIAVDSLELNAGLPRLSDKRIMVELEHLAFIEKSGLRVNDIMAEVEYATKLLAVRNFDVELPKSHLRFADLELSFTNPSDLSNYGREWPVALTLADGSVVTPADLAAFEPRLSTFRNPMGLTLDIHGTLAHVKLDAMRISSTAPRQSLVTDITGEVFNLDNRDLLRFEGITALVQTDAPTIMHLLDFAPKATFDQLLKPVSAVKRIRMTADVSGTLDHLEGKVSAMTAVGSLDADGVMTMNGRVPGLDLSAIINDLDIGALTDRPEIGRITADLDFAGTLGKNPAGTLTAQVESCEYRGYSLGNMTFTGRLSEDSHFNLDLDADNDLGKMVLAVGGSYGKDDPGLMAKGVVANFNPQVLGILPQYAGYRLSALMDIDLHGLRNQWVTGHARVTDIKFHDYEGDGKPLNIRKIALEANTVDYPNTVTLESDFINGRIDGRISPFSIGLQTRAMLASVMPALFGDMSGMDTGVISNNFRFDFSIANAEALSDFFNLPVQIVYPVNVDGYFDNDKGLMNATVDAPYLQQRDKIIDNTLVSVDIDRAAGRGSVYATTGMPTQKGPMALAASMSAAANRIDTQINWQIERQKAINGIISLSTLLGRNDNGAITADVAFNPGEITFGDAVWSIAPSHIAYSPKNLMVDNFSLQSGQQSVRVNGTANTDDASLMTLDIANLRLIKIFETLDINNALIGGRATGKFNIRGLFSGDPLIASPGLHVDSISYNYCVLGNAEVRAGFNNETKGVALDADVTAFDGRKSRIWGEIVPAGELLDINIEADHVNVGFMQPFMSAFAGAVTGYASGNAHLFGTFHDIDLEGDILAQDLGLKIDFTNTWYYCDKDSVHIRPGIINIDNITLHDVDGNTARLNGWVRHHYFHLPSFDFKVTDAHRLLCYDVGPKQSPDWYGRIYGDGTANITGRPGVVNIGANMRTTAGSTFTFVLSDAEEANEYNFITFRDATPRPVRDSLIETDPLPKAVREYRDRQLAKAAQQDRPSDYNMDIVVDITPEAALTIVMDPVGGDEIKSTGSGNLRMTYASQGNDLRMYGTYTIDRGKYNFTLQDIIVKDFTIDEGSSISFTGDPYSARLDIKAVYNVNANLSDLDESFLNDRDLNRTNVPVHAVLMARGDMRQPEIDFDLRFPTLTSDVDRKVKSIISTEDMMNRQIIYLLALNRFYTPDYMSTTKGNELFSVASSTLSSQLSSMIGKLTDKVSLNPNVRSDRGDFSDVEVDLGINGSLLDNRLRINGNFGYRDNTYNTNQFIGDVDLEYLLNRKGTWRLKAYNRFNDQNYYLRQAQTTQGVGIMFKRDFDRMFNFLRPKKAKTVKTPPTETDSVKPSN